MENAIEESLRDTEPPEFHLSVLNKQIREMMNRALRPYELRLVEWRILDCLRSSAGLTICDLAELAVIERTITGRLVEKLSHRGLLKKKTMSHDRRYSQVFLTARGENLMSSADSAVTQSRDLLFSGIDNAEISSLLTTLKRLQNNAVVAFHKTATFK